MQRVVRKGLYKQRPGLWKGASQADVCGRMGVPAEGVAPAKPSEFMEEQGAEWPRRTLEGDAGRQALWAMVRTGWIHPVGGRSDRI